MDKVIRNKGFTLVELVVVIAIIAILMTLAIVTINTVRRQSRNAQLRADARLVKSSLESYYTSYKTYPGSYDKINAYTLFDTGNGLTGLERSTQGAGQLKPFVSEVPDNPSKTGRICYTYTNGQASYWLWVLTEDSVASGKGCRSTDIKKDGITPVGAANAGYGAVKKGDHLNCIIGNAICDL